MAASGDGTEEAQLAGDNHLHLVGRSLSGYGLEVSATTLFAALSMLDGKVIGACLPRHRGREFLQFLKLIDQQTEAGLDLHLILDNYATHKNREYTTGSGIGLPRRA